MTRYLCDICGRELADAEVEDPQVPNAQVSYGKIQKEYRVIQEAIMELITEAKR